MQSRSQQDRNESYVYVVDDDKDFREHVALLLQEVALKPTIFANGLELLDTVSPAHNGCVVLDFRLPEVNGLLVTEILAERGIRMPVILTSGFLSVETAVLAMKAGCFDVIEKFPNGSARLLGTIQRAIVKDRERRRTCEERAVITSRKACLTPREAEVMELVVGGKRTKEIAAALGIGVGTVEIHRARVMRKMGVDSVAGLVRAAMQAASGG